MLALIAGICAGSSCAISIGALGEVFGPDYEITSLLCAALLLGSAVGARVTVGAAGESRRPLGLSGGLLVGTAISSLAFPLVLTVFEPTLLKAQEAIGPSHVASGGFAFGLTLLLGLPLAGFMGAAIVACTEHVRRREGLVPAVGLVLFAVLLGAAVAALAGPVCVRAEKRLWLAAAACAGQILIAAVAGLASQFEERAPIGPAAAPRPSRGRAGKRVFAPAVALGALSALGLFLTGRLVVYPLGGGLVAGSAVAAVIVGSLGLGCLGAAAMRRREGQWSPLLGKLLIAGAFASAVLSAFFSNALHHPQAVGALAGGTASLTQETLRCLGIAIPVAGLPCLLLGLAIPLLAGAAFERGRTIAESAGTTIASVNAGAGLALLLYCPIVSFTGLQAGVAIMAFGLAGVGAISLSGRKALAFPIALLAGYAFLPPPTLPQYRY